MTNVEVRRYASVAQFQADAASMARAGWVPVSQSEQTSGVRGAWVGVAVILLVVGFVAWYGLWVLAALAFLAAFLDRRRSLVVTYRYETQNAPGTI